MITHTHPEEMYIHKPLWIIYFLLIINAGSETYAKKAYNKPVKKKDGNKNVSI